MLKAIYLLPTIALATIATAKLPTFKDPPPIAPKLVTTESWRSQRSDTSTFYLRWRPLYDLPPAITMAEVWQSAPEPDIPMPRPRPSSADSVPEFRPKAGAQTQHRAARATLDLCQRHNRRKVYIGKYKWRCLR